MRVYAPGRSTAIQRDLWSENGSHRRIAFGIPLEGDWIDVPDYFRQVTSGLPINDVVHAKVVDSVDLSYNTADFTVSVQNRSYRVLQTQIGGYSNRQTIYISSTPYHTERVTEWIPPSPNYKGKNRRGMLIERSRRIIHPFAAAITVSNRPDRTLYRDHSVWYGAEVEFFFSQTPDPALSISQGSLSCIWADLKVEVLSDATRGRAPRNSDFRFTGFSLPKLREIRDMITSFSNGDILMPTEITSRGYALARKIAKHIVQNWITISDEIYAYSASHRGSWPSSMWKITHPLYNCTEAGLYSPSDIRSAFILNEADVLADKIDPMLLGTKGNVNSYWRRYLVEHALFEACDSLPRLSDNSIQNLVEIIGFIKSIVVDHRVEMPKSLADAWLAYRYQYGTGKQDIEEAIKFVHRRMDLGTLDRLISSYGTSTHVVDGTTVTCRCSIEVKPKNTNLLRKIWRALDTYGLTPDFYVIWDSIPYSFMVDWFLPIGDILAVQDASTKYFSGEYYDFVGICYSLSYSRDMGNSHVHCYTRWAGSVPTEFHSRYWFENPSTSAKTWVKRLLDAGSIFIG